MTGPDAVPNEIHVLAEPGKPPKQVVRDVQSFAMLKLGLDIDHRIVSVVQIGGDEFGVRAATRRRGAEDPEETALPRPAIGSIMVRTAGSRGRGARDRPRDRRPRVRGPGGGPGLGRAPSPARRAGDACAP